MGLTHDVHMQFNSFICHLTDATLTLLINLKSFQVFNDIILKKSNQTVVQYANNKSGEDSEHGANMSSCPPLGAAKVKC